MSKLEDDESDADESAFTMESVLKELAHLLPISVHIYTHRVTVPDSITNQITNPDPANISTVKRYWQEVVEYDVHALVKVLGVFIISENELREKLLEALEHMAPYCTERYHDWDIKMLSAMEYMIAHQVDDLSARRVIGSGV